MHYFVRRSSFVIRSCFFYLKPIFYPLSLNNRNLFSTTFSNSRLRDIDRFSRRIGDRVSDDDVSRLMGDIDEKIADLTVEPGKVIHDRIRIPPEAAQTFEQRITKFLPVGGKSDIRPINIGLKRPSNQSSDKNLDRLIARNQSNKELELLARTRQLRIPLEDVDREWLPREGVDAVYAAARHYGIYRDLFRDPHYFLPLVPLAVDYKFDAESDTRVYWGNKISARDVSRPPDRITFPQPATSTAGAQTLFWSLFLTCPDENFTTLNTDKEILHWAL
jgi:hypothetical protein